MANNKVEVLRHTVADMDWSVMIVTCRTISQSPAAIILEVCPLQTFSMDSSHDGLVMYKLQATLQAIYLYLHMEQFVWSILGVPWPGGQLWPMVHFQLAYSKFQKIGLMDYSSLTSYSFTPVFAAQVLGLQKKAVDIQVH